MAKNGISAVSNGSLLVFHHVVGKALKTAFPLSELC